MSFVSIRCIFTRYLEKIPVKMVRQTANCLTSALNLMPIESIYNVFSFFAGIVDDDLRNFF
jgi:hypothetical protein